MKQSFADAIRFHALAIERWANVEKWAALGASTEMMAIYVTDARRATTSALILDVGLGVPGTPSEALESASRDAESLHGMQVHAERILVLLGAG